MTLTRFRILLAACALMLITACAQLGMPAPETLAQRIAVTVSTVTAVRQSAGTLLAAKKISVADAENIQAQADNVVAGAAVARTLAPIDPAAADAKLQQTRAVLIALQAYLLSKESK
jgi:hypothetical protein